MRFEVTRRSFPLGNDFIIRNDTGAECYFVDGRAVSLRHKLLFLDMDGDLLAVIRHRLVSWGTTWLVIRKGNERARIRKNVFPVHRHRFDVTTTGALHMVVRGDFHGREFVLRRFENQHQLARVSSHWGEKRAAYSVEMSDEADPVLILSTCVAIDLTLHDELPR